MKLIIERKLKDLEIGEKTIFELAGNKIEILRSNDDIFLYQNKEVNILIAKTDYESFVEELSNKLIELLSYQVTDWETQAYIGVYNKNGGKKTVELAFSPSIEVYRIYNRLEMVEEFDLEDKEKAYTLLKEITLDEIDTVESNNGE